MYWINGKLMIGSPPVKNNNPIKKDKTEDPKWAKGRRTIDLKATAGNSGKGCYSIFYQGQKPTGHYNTHKG